MPAKTIPEPWRSFLFAIDEAVAETVALHCLGGFVMTVAYDLVRATSDVDVMMLLQGVLLTYSLIWRGKAPNYMRDTGFISSSSALRPFLITMKRGSCLSFRTPLDIFTC